MNPLRPLAVGIHTAHDAAVAICSPEGLLCSVAEERVSRIKHHYGFPILALETALHECGLSAQDIDLVAFSADQVMFEEQPRRAIVGPAGLQREARPLRQRLRRGWRRLKGRGRRPRKIESLWSGFEERHWSRFAGRMRELGLIGRGVRHYYVAHHRAHAAAAYHLSGLAEACVVTLDGKGGGLCGTIYRADPSAGLELVRSSRSGDSLGSFYQAVTEALGFVPVDGEFKTMGLAALGRPEEGANPLHTVHVSDGVLHSRIPWTFRSFNDRYPERRVPNPLGSISETEHYRAFLDDMPPEQLAHHAQTHCEEVMLAYVRDAVRLTGCGHVAAAGGVMLNVKANARIRDELRPSSFFVYPDAADSGLAAGAAMEALFHEGALRGGQRFDDPYLGHGFSAEQVWDEIERFGRRHRVSVKDVGEEHAGFLVDRLSAGRVIGTFQGRLEVGPRALGNRSVLADPRSEAIKERINALLKGREFFVPFAPIVLDEDAPKLWSGPTDYRYMTQSVEASAFAREAVPAVVHVDGTMRPQVVTRESNPWLYALLERCKEEWGVGVLVNTSFNRHGHPMVGAPRDALEHLVRGWVEAVIVDRWYVEREPGTVVGGPGASREGRVERGS